MKPWLLSLTLLLVSPVVASAGEFNETLSVGDAAPAWTELPGTDGKKHSLADLADKPVVVVVFTCASCPVAADYEERINSLVKTQGGADGKVAVVPVCVNRITEDQLPALTERVKSKGYAFHYVYDESQKIAKAYGANYTPEFFVLNKDRKVVYMGAMDDQTQAAKVTERYVDAAIQAAIEGKTPEKKEVIARGCRIRYARERSSK